MTEEIQWSFKKIKIKDLKEYEKNPRILTKDQSTALKESLSRFGVCEPIIINQDNTIIGGHQRARTLKKLGYKETTVCVPNRELTSREVEELNIRLNKNVGEWDWECLGNLWNPNDLVDWGFSLEELHLDNTQDTSSKTTERKRTGRMTITFKDLKHLQEAENRISTIVDEYEGAFYRIKIDG